jgi:hypothetical protein
VPDGKEMEGGAAPVPDGAGSGEGEPRAARREAGEASGGWTQTPEGDAPDGKEPPSLARTPGSAEEGEGRKAGNGWGTPSGGGPEPAGAEPDSLTPRGDRVAKGPPPTAGGGRGRLTANGAGSGWMGGGEARWTYEKGISPSGDGPRPEEALRGVLPPRGDIAAHRPPPAGGMECGSPEGGRGSPGEAEAGRSAGGEMCSDERHLGDGERRRQGGGPGLGTAVGVKEEGCAPVGNRRRWRQGTGRRTRRVGDAFVRARRAREATRYHQPHHPLQCTSG